MKVFYFITLSFFFAVSSFAASQNCVDNFNKSIRLYDEGRSLFIEARENYEAFNKLKDMVIRNKGRKRHSKFNRTEKTIEAIELLNQAIAKTREAKEKFRLGNNYNAKAQEYCDDENAAKAKQDFDTSQQYLEKITKRLTGQDPSQATSFIPDYSTAKTDLLNDLIRYRKTQAIYMIENEEIDLNSSSREDGWTPLHTAVSQNDMDITKALVEAGANINQQSRDGYTPLMLAAINGNARLFSYLFEHNASAYLLTGFNADNRYKNCNIADLVIVAKTGKQLEGSELYSGNYLDGHQEILGYLQDKGLVPVCSLDPVIATVNGEKIFKSSVDFIFAHEFRSQIENSNQQLPAEQETKIRADILDYLILQELQGQLARQKGMTVDTNQRDEQVQDICNRLDNIDRKWLEHYIENEMLAQMIIQKDVIDHIKIPEQELHRYYEEHPESFQQPETICARHIIVKSKEEAQRLLALVKQNPENFGELAKQYSTGPTASKGGDLGCFNRNKMVEEFSTAAFALDAGEISDVIQTQFGYHIIEVTSKTPAETVPFDVIRGNLKKWFLKQKAKEEIPKWQDSLRNSAKIEIIQSDM